MEFSITGVRIGSLRVLLVIDQRSLVFQLTPMSSGSCVDL